MLVHAFGGHQVAVEVLPDEFVNQDSGDFVVEALLFQVIDVQILMMDLN